MEVALARERWISTSCHGRFRSDLAGGLREEAGSAAQVAQMADASEMGYKVAALTSS